MMFRWNRSAGSWPISWREGNSASSVRSYAYALLRWWRWLIVVGVAWDRATAAETRDFVLWLGQASKPQNAPRARSAATAGTVNPATGKRYLSDCYEPRTVRHSNAVLRSFYDFFAGHRERRAGQPGTAGRRGHRPYAHHNPLEPVPPQGRLRYNPKLPKRRPRPIPDQQWNDLFGRLRSNRDRAILAVAISNACRAGELLGIRTSDVDWGDQRVRVRRKGTGAEQWLPVSPDAFVWLMLYLADLGAPLDPDQPLWWTLRRRDHGRGLQRQPLNYEALRAVLRRANAALGTNWSMHDLRHTCALRMARDKTLSLKDIQTILGHQHLSTTADTYLIEQDTEVVRRVLDHLADRHVRGARPQAAAVAGYDAADLSVLFGGTVQ